MIKRYFKRTITGLLAACILFTSIDYTFCGVEEEIIVSADEDMTVEEVSESDITSENNTVSDNEASNDEITEDIIISSEKVSSLSGRKASAMSTSSEFPSRFRANEYGWVTSDKGQSMDDCQSFAAIAVIETNILKNNISVAGKKMNKDTLDLSELYHYSFLDLHEASIHPIWWKGPVTEDKAPYTGSPIDPELFQTLKQSNACDVHVKDVLRVKDEVDCVKKAIMENGSCYWGIYRLSHAVQVIGWDDNYIDPNGIYSSGSYWACKDSGTNSGKIVPISEEVLWHGAYWLEGTFTSYIVDDFDKYDNNRKPEYTRYSNKAGRQGSCYTLPDNGNEKKENLAGVILHTTGSGTLDVYKIIDGKRTLAATASYGLPDYAYEGYITVPLSQTVSVSPGEEIEIVTNKSDNGYVYLERILTKNTDIEVKNRITLDAHEIRLSTSETAKINATVTNGSDTVSFKSYDESVAKVDSNGNITPVAVGETYIEAKTNGDVKYCEVIVKCYNGDIEIQMPDAGSLYYTGEALTPSVKLMLNGVELKEGTDWEINCYENNVIPGTGCVTVKLLGKYAVGDSSDYLQKDFTIKKMSLASVKEEIKRQGGLKFKNKDFYPLDKYNPENKYTMEFSVKNSKGSTEILDFPAQAVNNSVGEQRFNVTVPENAYTEAGIITGEEYKAEIKPCYVSSVTITMDEEANDAMLFKQGEYTYGLAYNISQIPFLYTGKPVEPKVKEITVDVNGNTYKVPKEDYTVVYGNNVEETTKENPATIEIAFKNYKYDTEKYKKIFLIAKNPLDGMDMYDITNANASQCWYNWSTKEYEYSGEQHVPFGNVPSIEDAGWGILMPECRQGIVRYDIPLRKDIDYTITVDESDPVWTDVNAYMERKNTPKGQNWGSAYGKVVVKGIGKYKGEFSYDISIADLCGREYADYADKEIEKMAVSVSDTKVMIHDETGYEYDWEEPVVTISYNGYTYRNNEPDFPSCFRVYTYCNGEPGERYISADVYTDEPFSRHCVTATGKAVEVWENKPQEPENPNPEDPQDPDTPEEPKENSLVLLKGEKKQLTQTGNCTSSNKSVVAVKVKNGVITLTAKKAGTADLTILSGAEKTVLHVTVEDVKLRTKKISVNKGESTAFPLTMTSQEVSYRSSNESIVTVDANGNLAGVQKGNAKVTATVHGMNFTVTVQVEEPAISQADLYLNVKKTKQLKINGTKGKAVWSVDDPGVASVKNGKVKGLSCGRTTVRAVVNGKEFSCSVQVDNPVLHTKKLSLNKGDSVSFPLSCTDPTLRPVFSVNGSCISVTEDGVITGLTYGSATVTADLFGYRYKVKVQVDDPQLSAETCTLKVGKSAKLKLLQTKSKVTWTSENPSIATVKNGSVKALSVGETVIAATVNGHSYTCRVSVE